MYTKIYSDRFEQSSLLLKSIFDYYGRINFEYSFIWNSLKPEKGKKKKHTQNAHQQVNKQHKLRYIRTMEYTTL